MLAMIHGTPRKKRNATQRNARRHGSKKISFEHVSEHQPRGKRSPQGGAVF